MNDLPEKRNAQISRRRMLYGLVCMAGVAGGLLPASAYGDDTMRQYHCNRCGHVYDPKAGDSTSGIKPGTKFDDLPADWACPVCGAGKKDFKRL